MLAAFRFPDELFVSVVSALAETERLPAVMLFSARTDAAQVLPRKTKRAI